MINGVGLNQTVNKIYPGQQFLFPAMNRPPLIDGNQQAFFLSTNGTETLGPQFSTALRIFNAIDLDTYVEIPYPTEMTFAYDSGVLQPPPDDYELDTFNEIVINAVVYKNSIWCVQMWSPEPGRVITRWYELDITNYFTDNQVTIKQFGDINPCPSPGGSFLNTTYPAINVDRDGNMAIAFTLVGREQYATVAYTGRLACDPPGTVRYPFQIALKGTSTYDQYRWGDYINLPIDPTDHKTFWSFNEYPDTTRLNKGTTSFYAMIIYSFKLNQTCNKKCNKPKSRTILKGTVPPENNNQDPPEPENENDNVKLNNTRRKNRINKMLN